MKKTGRVLLLFIHFNILFLILVGIFSLWSCTPFISGYVYEKENPTVKYVYISLESGKNIVAARTITASAIDFTDTNSNDSF